MGCNSDDSDVWGVQCNGLPNRRGPPPESLSRWEVGTAPLLCIPTVHATGGKCSGRSAVERSDTSIRCRLGLNWTDGAKLGVGKNAGAEADWAGSRPPDEAARLPPPLPFPRPVLAGCGCVASVMSATHANVTCTTVMWSINERVARLCATHLQAL